MAVFFLEEIMESADSLATFQYCNLLNCSGKCFEEIECKQLKPVPTVKFELKLENTK